MAAKKPETKSAAPAASVSPGDLDATKYVNFLVAAEMDKDKATQMVDRIIKMINNLMPKSGVDEKDHMIMIKLREATRAGESEKFRGLIIALDELKDQMGYLKYVAREAYKKDKQRAKAEGLVTIEGDKIIEMDTRKFLDNAKTKPNKNLGKKLPTVMRREALLIIEGALVRAFGNFEAEVGREYDFYGFMNEKNILNISSSPAPKLIDSLDDKALWERASEVLGGSDMAMDLSAIPDQEKNTHVITHGTLQHVTDTSSGGTMCFVADDEVPKGIACFSSCDSVAEEMNGLGKGSEVIIIGRVMRNRGPDGEERVAISTTGIIQDPHTAGRSDILSQLDEAVFD